MPTSNARSPAWPFEPRVAVRHLKRADPELGAVIESMGTFALVPERMPTTFEALARAIVYQQLSGKAAATIWGRLVAAHPNQKASAAGLLSLSEAAIRGVGISGPKQRALRDLATRCEAGSVPQSRHLHTMDEEAIVESLTKIRGIGRWSVEMLLIFRLGRPDVLPITDLGIRKGFQKAFGGRSLPSERTLLRRGERWRPYRTVASWYLWRSLDQPVVI